MITASSLAIASHHAIVAEFIADPQLALTEVSYSQFTVSLSVEDAESLMHLYDRLKCPGRHPRVSVFEHPQSVTQFGPHAFVMVKEIYSTPEHPDTEIVASLMLTDKLDLHASRTIEPGLALIESLATAFVLRKETD